MKKRLVVWGLLLAVLLVPGSFAVLFSVPDEPQLTQADPLTEALPQQCSQYPAHDYLDHNGTLKLVVWNIYKQNRPDWQPVLQELSADANLLLLQEASMSGELHAWLQQKRWQANQVNAFEVLGEPAGVLNAARVAPQQVCAFTALEPWLRLPKSALYALYPLSSGQSLALVNLHAINFTLGTAEYQSQIEQLLGQLQQHQGPVIVAGDFNSWSEERTAWLSQAMTANGLQEVHFNPDQRVRFINGLPLDHVFFKQLSLKTAEAPVSDASDHNPLLVTFTLSE